MSTAELGQEDDFNYGYNFDFTEKSVRLGNLESYESFFQHNVNVHIHVYK